ncbi:MAG: hypothetical protein ACKOUR_11685, partial [Planctomycetota bacterium]
MQRYVKTSSGLARSTWWMRGRNAWRAAVTLVGLLAFLACGAGVAEAQEVPNTRPVDGRRQNNPTRHALVGARVVVAPGQVLDSATVIIREGVIVEVGPKVTVPPGARVWDLAGKTIYAGFIDAYGEAEFADVDLRAGAPHWNSQVVPQLQVAEHYKVDGGALDKLRRQGFGARLVAPSAGIIKGVSALVSTGDDDASRAILQPHVAQHLRLTLSRGGGRGGFPNSPMGAVALVRQTLLDTQWYRDAWKVYATQPSLPAPERNDALDALQAVVSGELLTIADASDEQFVLRAD